MQGFLNPEEILDQLELSEDTKAAEFGCGTGEFAFALAKRLPGGKVFGIDIQPEPLLVFDREARRKNILNVASIKADLEKESGSTLGSGSLGLVLIPNLLFQVENKKAILKEASRVTKQGGSLLVIDWKLDGIFGPEMKSRVSAEKISVLAEKEGWKKQKEFDASAFHWGLILERSDLS